MAKSSKELVNDLLKQNKLTDELKEKFAATAKAIADGGDNLDRWGKLLREILTEIDDIANQADFVKQSFQDSIQALTKANIALNLQRKALRGISSIAGEILDIRLGESKVSTEILNKLKQQSKSRLNQLTLARDVAAQQGKQLEAINDEIRQTERLIGGFEKMQKVVDQTNNDLGFTPKILGGIDKALQKMGFEGLGISDAIDQVQMLAQRADAAGTEFNALGSFTSIVFQNMKKSVSATKILELVVLAIYKTFTKLDESTGKLAKQLGQSYNQTKLMKKEFSEIAKSSDNLFITTSSLTHSFETLADRFGTIGGFSEATLKAQTELVKQAGYSEESASEIAKFSLITGESSKDLTASAIGTAKAFNMQNGLLLNEKALLEDALKTSSAIQVSFGNSTDELILAVATAKKFGLELDQVDAIANSLLDFESSIANELEAELLLGKDINLEKARSAALNNDLATVAKEIADQVGNSADFAAMNRIQQEAIAKSVGLSREDLAKSLQEQEAIAKLGGDAASSQEAYNNMLAEGLTHQQIAKKLGNEQLANSLKGNSVQEKFAQALEKAQELFVSIVTSIQPFISGLATGVGYIAAFISKFQTLLKIVLAVVAAEKILGAFQSAKVAAQVRYNSLKGYEFSTSNTILYTMGLQELALKRQTGQLTLQTAYKGAIAAIEKTILGSLLMQGAAYAKSIVMGTIDLGIRIAQAAAAMATAAASTLGVGVPVIVAATIAGVAAIGGLISSMTSADDMMSPPSGYGDRILSSPKGSIALNNQDTVVAGTNLGGGSGNKETNALLKTLVTQNAKKPQISPVGLYSVQ